jgi:hypothetical protein
MEGDGRKSSGNVVNKTQKRMEGGLGRRLREKGGGKGKK